MRSQAEGHHPDLRAALDHLVASGGKRIRPTLTILTGRMLGADEDRTVTLAAAIELLHTATLVHDDLIDGSLLRRRCSGAGRRARGAGARGGGGARRDGGRGGPGGGRGGGARRG